MRNFLAVAAPRQVERSLKNLAKRRNQPRRHRNNCSGRRLGGILLDRVCDQLRHVLRMELGEIDNLMAATCA